MTSRNCRNGTQRAGVRKLIFFPVSDIIYSKQVCILGNDRFKIFCGACRRRRRWVHNTVSRQLVVVFTHTSHNQHLPTIHHNHIHATVYSVPLAIEYHHSKKSMSSSYSSGTPRNNNRRMTLSTLPTNNHSTTNHRPVEKAPPHHDTAKASSSSSSHWRLPPKGRQSMIPRVGGGGRENIPGTPSGGSSSSHARTGTTSTPSSSMLPTNRRRSVGGGGSSSSSSSSSNNNNNNNNHGSSSSLRRQSMIPPSNSSGSSVSSVSSVGPKADPRPINDRNYQHQCMKDLLSFLQETGYEYPISIKTLSRPSAKDFTNMTTFLLRQVDKDFQRGGMKFEDEVSLNFKCLGYPYPISKTALVAAGTPHTWPSLLAALTWLMHQLQCQRADLLQQRNELELGDDDTRNDFSSIVDLETQTDKAFFQYMGRAYSAFMQGDAAALEALETAFMQRFERDDAFLAQAVERVTDLNASIVERIHEIAQRCEEYVYLCGVCVRACVVAIDGTFRSMERTCVCVYSVLFVCI